MSETSLVVGGAISIVAASVGAIVAYVLAERRDRRKEFNQGAAEFKSNFISELRYLDSKYWSDRDGGWYNIHETLTAAFDRHEIAVIKFRPFLSRAEGTGFDKAWDDYCNKEDGKPHFMDYAEPSGVINCAEARKSYLERLDSLLAFAKLK